MTSASLANLGPEEKRALLKRLLAERAAAGVGDYPLSHGQRALWFLNRLSPDSHAYNLALPLRCRPALDRAVLQRSIDRLVARHAALRTVFTVIADQPVQRVLPPQSVPIHVVDMTGASDDEVYAALVAEHRRPFALESGAFTAVLFARPGDDALLLRLHHIIIDAWSLEIVFNDLHALYEADARERPAELRAVAMRYSDFVAAEARMVTGQRGDELREYWSRTLAAPLPSVDLSQSASPTVASRVGASVPFNLGLDLSEAVYALAKQQGTTLYTVMLVATQMLVYRLSDQSDVIIGTPVALRGASEFADVVGYFVNTVPIRGAVHADDTVTALLARARAQILGALEHQEYPFSLMVDRLQIRRDSNRNPIFQVLLNVLLSSRSGVLKRLFATDGESGVSFGSSSVVPYVLPQQEGQFELTFEVIEADGLLSANLHYQPSLYSEERALELRDAFIALLEASVAEPGRRVADLRMPDRETFEL